MIWSRHTALAVMTWTVLASSFATSPVLAASFTVSDLEIGQGPKAGLVIPQVEVVDGNMTEDDIRRMFKGPGVAEMARSLASWDAVRILIPEFKFREVVKSPNSPDATVEFVYRDLVIENMQDGIAQSLRLEGGDFSVTGPETLTGSVGSFTTGMIDLTAIAGFYAGGGGEMKTFYKDVVFEGAKFGGPEGSCEMGRLAAAEFKARPMKMSLLDYSKVIESMSGGEPSPADVRSLIEMYVDVFQGMESSPVTVDSIACDVVDEHGTPVSFSIGKMEIEGFGNGRYPALAMSDLDITVTGEGFIKIDKFLFKGMDLNGVIEAVTAAGAELSEAWFDQNVRRLIPDFEGFGLAGVSFDLPDEAKPDQRIKGSLGASDLTLKAYRAGIPTDISMTSDNLVVDLPAETTDEDYAQLKALGYDRIDMSGAGRLHWDEASKTIVIDEMSTSGADMGSVSFAGIIGNAGQNLFSEDLPTMQMAVMGLTVKELSVSTEDDGFAERIFALVGKQQGQDPTAVRTQVSGMAAGMVPMMLGGTEEAQKVATAVMTFLNGGSSLKVTAVAKEAAGLGLLELMAAQANPVSLVEKVNISAEAQ